MGNAADSKNAKFRMRRLRSFRKDNGLCIYCGGKKDDYNRRFCDICNERFSVVAARKQRMLRKLNHKCGRCGAPLEDGESYAMCFNCRHGREKGAFKPKECLCRD